MDGSGLGEQEALFTHLAAVFQAATRAVSIRKPEQELVLAG